jgi:hypothetical protein
MKTLIQAIATLVLLVLVGAGINHILQLQAGSPREGIGRQAAYHLQHCKVCRENDVTVEMLSLPVFTPPCVVFNEDLWSEEDLANGPLVLPQQPGEHRAQPALQPLETP